MLFIQVAPDKISPETFPGLREWIDELNTIRAFPVSIVMAVEDDIPQGVMVYELGNVIYLYVKPSERRCGVGNALMKYAKGKTTTGILTAKVHSGNVPGICFLTTCGFTITSWLTGEDNIRYLRMTNAVDAVHTPPEEKYLDHFVRNVPVFITMAEGNF